MHAATPPRSRPAAALRQIALVLLWTVIVVAGVEFLLVAHAKYHDLASQAYALFAARRGWLWTHLAGGAVTLVLGPLQFVTRLRVRRPRLHRWIGRVYLGGLLVGAIGATGLIAGSPAPASIRIAFASTAIAWLVTAGSGLHAILRGEVQRHRAWMVRNYAVTLAPVLFRSALRVAVAGGLLPTPALIASLLWASWVLPVVACVGVMAWLARRRARVAMLTSAA